ncbi:hypothetical protein BD626DRAFT_576034 [Schizophyllum amplum]|uniref:MYND-type domain-containing protein n=1 Tax=Schizophyllum amplum TaxID=97359 RepID=A0A550BUG5_9AGAR|nr:hypothetical protein BD626DRAFT_576034 [Auriculariopsis ampla]
MSFKDPRSEREYYRLRTIRDIAHELAGDRPYPPGTSQSSQLAKIRSLLDDPDDPAFPTLTSQPPSGTISYDSDVFNVILTSFNVFTVIWDASKDPRNRSLAPTMRALWPHIVRWGAVLHPARGRLMRTPTQRNSGRDVAGIVQAYLTIIETDVTYVKPFLHANPDAVAQIFELWLEFHNCIPPSAMDASGSAHGAIEIIVIAYTHLANCENHPTAEDRALFVDALSQAVGTKRALYLAFARQTDFLASLTMMPPLVPQIWRNHFGLLTVLARLPEFSRQKIPRCTVTSIVAAANRCVKLPQAVEGTQRAVVLITSLCRVARDSRPLAHAAQAGVFDLLRNLSYAAEEYDASDLAHHLCTGLFSQVRVVRAFHRFHPQPWDVGPVVPQKKKAQPQATWKDVARVWNSARETYLLKYCKKDWRRTMGCHNSQGPHNRLVRVCPCASVFYCSGSCQRMHWAAAHREDCRAEDGPWGLRGTLSLGDAIFICTVVRSYILAHRTAIAGQMPSILPKGQKKGAKQAVILVDLTVVPGPRHEVCTRTGDSHSAGMVLVEVALRVGRSKPRRVLPFTYDAGYFNGAVDV